MAKRKPTIAIVEITERGSSLGTPSGRDPTGLTTFISWHRLAREALPQSGNVRPEEAVTHFVLTEDGIQVYLSSTRRA